MKKKATFGKHYRESYLLFGFDATGDIHTKVLSSITCSNRLSNEATKPLILPQTEPSRYSEAATELRVIQCCAKLCFFMHL